ncbi:hypothetical protein [Aminobacter ciceronei]|uniref:Uncharacterized protein n=1 Tax=Aminobacter ciceronei TaxID=150723 RepID=A0ABR6CGA1_9HYPH|nr:hypothetical protein [Aminobacter ciceronei]MBA8910164.1 hypothetical protein [Aminobacter ciceronei]MBA9023936.1 hypothetical protein [Aminobacter ciceronei]
MSEDTSQQAQIEAFEAYKAARAKAEASQVFHDAMAAKRAWWFFLNLVDGPATPNVVAFPKRPPEIGGAA